jgi:hypothetical protein
MSSKEEEQDYLPIIDYRFPNLKYDQDKISRNCPLLAIPYLEREYLRYGAEEITYLDYTYCVNETRLPLLRTLHSQRTLYRVSFYWAARQVSIEVFENNRHLVNLGEYYLTARPRNRFTHTATLQRGTFPSDHLVFNGLPVSATEFKKRDYIKHDPRYFKEIPTIKEWDKKIKAPIVTHKYTFEEIVPTREQDWPEFFRQRSFGNRPYTRTIEVFSGQIRTSKKKRSINFDQKSCLKEFKLRRTLSKRAPTWTIESAFDPTLNPFLHVGIYYYLTSIWIEKPERK